MIRNYTEEQLEANYNKFIDAIKKLPKVLKRYFRKFGKLENMVFRPKTNQMGRIYSVLLPKLLKDFKDYDFEIIKEETDNFTPLTIILQLRDIV